MIFKSKSTTLSLLSKGKYKDVFSPWHIIVDVQENSITVKKLNWFLIGVDEQYIAFRFIRNITIDEHLFGADLLIKAIGGKVEVFCLPKNDVQKIKEILNNYNKTRGKKLIFA